MTTLSRFDYIVGAHVLEATPGIQCEGRFAPGAMVVWIADFLRRRTARLQVIAHARRWRPGL